MAVKTNPMITDDTVRPRRVKAPKKRLYKRQDKRFKARPKLPNAFRLFGQASQLIFKHWKLVGGIVLVYGLLNVLLVRGINGGISIADLKSQTDSLFHGATGHLASGFTVFALLVSSSNNVASSESSAYQTILLIIVSMALVWSYRQLLAGVVFRIRDAFYQGMQQLIPVILVLLVVAVQLLPLLFGVWLYATLVGDGIAITGLERLGTGIVSLVLVALSVYWTCSSFFALYIAALPGMTPMKALRSARELVRYRRWPLIRKLLFLPLALLVLGALIMLPLILVVPVMAQWVFFVLSMAVLAVIHAYMYTLYRELLNE